jgi:hypothetical protein
MTAPKTLDGDLRCAACENPAQEWVLVFPDSANAYRAVCTRCRDRLENGVHAEAVYRTWSFI